MPVDWVEGGMVCNRDVIGSDADKPGAREGESEQLLRSCQLGVTRYSPAIFLVKAVYHF